MAYRYTPEEISRLEAARRLAPEGIKATTHGNWVPLYRELSAIMGERIAEGRVQGSDLQDMKDFKLWLDVAIGANGNTGMHSAFIRTFTNEQGRLRIGREFTAEEMQKASNGVAVNLWRDISGEGVDERVLQDMICGKSAISVILPKAMLLR